MASEPEIVEVPEDDEATFEGEEEVLEDDPVDARLCALMSDAIFNGFDRHVEELKAARKRRQEALAFKSAVEEEGAAADEEGGAAQTQDELDGMGVRLPVDKWQGDCNMRTLQKLLSRVDARGFERSAQQLEFHQAFMKAAARVIYRGDWETDRPMIMDKYGWNKCNSEVLIRRACALGNLCTHTCTYACACRAALRAALERRFRALHALEPITARLLLTVRLLLTARCDRHGSIAIFCACLALALGLEIVVFSKQRVSNPNPLMHCSISHNSARRSRPSRVSEAP
jgi:hypothetical protein